MKLTIGIILICISVFICGYKIGNERGLEQARSDLKLKNDKIYELEHNKEYRAIYSCRNVENKKNYEFKAGCLAFELTHMQK